MADEDADDGSSGTPSILQRYLVIMSLSPLVAYNCLLNHCDLSCSRIAARDWSLLVRAELFRRGHYVTPFEGGHAVQVGAGNGGGSAAIPPTLTAVPW